MYDALTGRFTTEDLVFSIKLWQWANYYSQESIGINSDAIGCDSKKSINTGYHHLNTHTNLYKYAYNDVINFSDGFGLYSAGGPNGCHYVPTPVYDVVPVYDACNKLTGWKLKVIKIIMILMCLFNLGDDDGPGLQGPYVNPDDTAITNPLPGPKKRPGKSTHPAE